MAGIRRLFINDAGLDKYAALVEKNTDKFADVIEAREYILKQAKFASKLPKVKSISLVESGYWKIRTRDLFITTTDTGRLRKWFVGDWRVEVDYYGDIFWYPSTSSIRELGFNSGIWNSTGHNTVHPHISTTTNHACLGNAATPLQMYIKNGDIKAFCLYAIGYLESVNIEDSAGVYLGKCHEIELDDAGNPVIDEEGNYTYIANEFGDSYEYNSENRDKVSSVANTLIDTTYKEYITTSAVKCKVCNTWHNKNHMKYINFEGESCYACDECASNLVKCDVCGHLSKITHEDKEHGIKYCALCAVSFVRQCKFCNEDMFLPVDKTSSVPIKLQLEYNKMLFDIKDNSNRLLYETGYALACDDCKSAIKSTPVKDKILYGTRLDITENLFKLDKYVPLHTYKVKCDNCGREHYVENMIKIPRSRKLCVQ